MRTPPEGPLPDRMPSLLLVDDDADALAASAALLELLGYRVTAVDDPLHALDLLHDGKHFDVLLTDVVMPKMSGIRLGEEALRACAGLRIVYLTGYSEELVAGDRALHGKLLLKPWTVEELENAIRAP